MIVPPAPASFYPPQLPQGPLGGVQKATFHPNFSRARNQMISATPSQWPQFPLDTTLEPTSHPEFPPQKKQRNSVSDHLNQNQPTNLRVPPCVIPPVIKGVNKMFFKTRICEKFMQGTCPYGSNCNFAHGADDMRKPPPNWKEIMAAHGDERGEEKLSDHQKIISKLRICRKHYYGEGCPYGSKCNFVHKDPEKIRENIDVMVDINGKSSNFTESNAGSISVHESRSCDGVVISVVDSKSTNCGNLNSATEKTVYWKTKICSKWETSGHCPFGEKCHFAHGQAELHKFVGVSMEIDSGNAGSALPRFSPGSTSFISARKAGTSSELRSRTMRLAKLNGPSLISRVYADWLEDIELDG